MKGLEKLAYNERLEEFVLLEKTKDNRYKLH